MRRFDASQVATFSNGAPVLTIVWGIWLFGERLTPTLLVGSALALAGIYWATRPRRVGRVTRSTFPQFRIGDVGAPSERVAVAPVLALTEERSA
jgi:hypothetical protein